MTRWPTLRGIILFFFGLAGEVVLTVAWLKGTEPNQALMFLFATMMGLPVFLQRDEQKPGPIEREHEPEPPDELPRGDDEHSTERRRPDAGRTSRDRTW